MDRDILDIARQRWAHAPDDDDGREWGRAAMEIIRLRHAVDWHQGQWALVYAQRRTPDELVWLASAARKVGHTGERADVA